MKRSKKVAALGLLTAFSFVAAACGSDSGDSTEATTAETTAATTAETTAETTAATEPMTTEAAGEAVCPTNIVVQTDWWPEVEHGGTYQLIGPDGTANAENFTYSGPIQDKYKVGGVETVEIRAGGDAVSFQSGDALLVADNDIIFAYLPASDVIKASATVPLVAVAKTLELDPQMVQWDPTQNDVQKPEDIAASGKQFLYFDGASWVDFMEGSGYITADQRNPSYGGAPDQWVAEGGNFFQQGFATAEVFKYENIIPWKDGEPADVSYYTVGDLGFPNYPAVMTILASRLDELSPCLELLVPMLQQGWIDFFADPVPVSDALTAINETYDTYWKLTPEGNAAGVQIMVDEGYSANSPDGTYCSLDPERMQTLQDILQPIYEAAGNDTIDDVSTIFTNDFCANAPGA
jgi:hypothetical protein